MKTKWVDAPEGEDFKFKMTPATIARAIPGDAEHCLISEAGKEVRGVIFMETRPNFARVGFADGRRWIFSVPRELGTVLRAFDIAGETVVPPGTYVLTAPTGVRKIANRRKARAAHAERAAKGEAKTYKPREKTVNTVSHLQGVRSSRWGALPEMKPAQDTFDSRPSRFEQVATGSQTGEPSQAF